MKKVKKYIDYVLSLVSKAIREKKYRNENSTLKYLFYTCKNSKDMVVVFSACTRVGIPARYVSIANNVIVAAGAVVNKV